MSTQVIENSIFGSRCFDFLTDDLDFCESIGVNAKDFLSPVFIKKTGGSEREKSFKDHIVRKWED